MSLYIFMHVIIPHLQARFGTTQWVCHVPHGLQPALQRYLEYLARLQLAAPVCLS